MRKKLQRGLCFILCVVMAFSCMAVPAGAIVISPAIISVAKAIGTAVGSWLVGETVDATLQTFKDWVDGKTTDPTGYIAPVGALRTAQKTKVTEDRLRELAYEWNITCSEAVGFTVDVVDHRLDTGEEYLIIAVRRGYVVTTAATQWCFADGMQRILYCDATTELSGRWAPEEDTRGRHLLDYNALFNLSQEVGGQIRLKDNFYEIYKRDGTLYCNVAGRRFSSIYESDKTAVNQDRPTTGGTVIEGDTITNIENNDNSVTNDYYQDIDIGSMTHVLPGGTLNEIDNLIYDDNTKTYYVDSHDVTNNFTNYFFYQYHINYTSITYIGQTEEYNKRYELYYQLADGRDSADLTPEELEQLNVDLDVVPYVRYSDNFDVRSLYHFDGDTLDDSYWNYLTSFSWSTGASLTYMESGAFNGALYLDENKHDFTMTLPSALDTNFDWTLQFRLYQSHTEAPVNDSAVYVGGHVVLKMDGSRLYTTSGEAFSPMPIGTWNELCIVRKDNRLYYYLNGVYYTSVADNIYRSTSAVRFDFGDQQQTYKYLDELRFMRGTIFTAGQNYTPTSVPYDSNLTLVLPTGSDGIADETLMFTPSENNLLTPYKLDDWSKLDAYNSLTGSAHPFEDLMSSYFRVDGYPFLANRSAGDAFYLRNGYFEFQFKNTAFTMLDSVYDTTEPASCLALPLYHHYFVNDGTSSIDYGLIGSWKYGKPYTLSVVLADGSFSSITFQLVRKPVTSIYAYGYEILGEVNSSVIQFSVEDLGYPDWVDDDDLNWRRPVTSLCFNSVTGKANVKYIELIEGSSPGFKIEYESTIYDADDLKDAPILAVKTDVVITDYQIGGVRPSVPEKGQVWALVESGYITSLQVYNGSVWLNADGRIWTGSRWIPANSYNVITLQDMYDIVDATQDYEYIYTESGFWSWFQRAWKDLISRLDKIIEGMGLGSSAGECQHVYDIQLDKEATCTDVGHAVYTCTVCGHTYSGLVDPLGHDWVVTDHVDPTPLQSSKSSGMMYAMRPGPVITQQPLSGTTTEGGPALTFTVKAEGAAPLTYQWQYLNNGTWASVPGNSTASSLGLGAYAYRNGWQLRCVVTDANGRSTISSVATMTVKSPITMTSQPYDQELLKNEIAEFSIKAEGTGLQYQWEYSTDGSTWASIPGNSTDASIRLTVTDVRNGWKVRCVITDANGYFVVSDVATLTMKPPIVITTQPESQEILKGEIAAFVVKAEGTGLKYQWQYRINGNAWSNIPGNSTDSDVRLTGLDSRNGWQIRCVITDAAANTVYSDVVSLSVYLEHGYDILTCSRCGATAEDHGNGIVSSDGAPYEDFTITGLFLDAFDGAWSVIVGVVNTGFGGLGGLVEGFSIFPDFFALYRPSNQAGVLGIYNYGGADIWD